MIDVIIPVLNEESVLLSEREYFKKLSLQTNLIFVDGGSSDQTIKLAEKFGQVIRSNAGRGAQKNMGAAQAQTKVFIFKCRYKNKFGVFGPY